jgi:hypothetical protein
MDAERQRRRGGDRADGGKAETAREHRQEMLDEALDDTFPASDPPAVRPNREDPDPLPESADQADEEDDAG